MGFIEAFQRIGRRDTVVEIFTPDAAHKARNNATARNNVEHGDFLGDPQGVAMQGDGIADNADRDFFRPLHQHRGDNVWRRHRAIEIRVMFVDRNRVETELFGSGELVEVFGVQRVAAMGVIILIRQRHPG